MSAYNRKTAAVVSIRYVVMSILNELKEYSMKDYEHLAQLVIEGFSNLNMYHLRNVEVAYLTMNSQKIVDMPGDMVDYVKIGIPINGKIYTLTLNDNMTAPRGESCGTVQNAVESSELSYGYYFTDHFRNGQYVAGLYGLGGGFNSSYYNLDWERRQIWFSDDLQQSEVVIEYISTGVNLSSSSLIPRQAVAPIKAYVHWKRLEYDNRVPMNDKMRKESLYEQEVNRLVDFEHTPTMDEFIDTMYEDLKQGVKR